MRRPLGGGVHLKKRMPEYSAEQNAKRVWQTFANFIDYLPMGRAFRTAGEFAGAAATMGQNTDPFSAVGRAIDQIAALVSKDRSGGGGINRHPGPFRPSDPVRAPKPTKQPNPFRPRGPKRWKPYPKRPHSWHRKNKLRRKKSWWLSRRARAIRDKLVKWRIRRADAIRREGYTRVTGRRIR